MQKPKEWDELGVEGCFSWENESDFFIDVISITQPTNILETGFFRGASAFLNLYLSKAKLTSVDPMVNLYDSSAKHDGLLENVQKLKDHFGADRFTFIQKDSRVIRPDIAGQHFDLMFIDGDHLDSGIRNDLQLALDMNIKWVLVDDFVTNVKTVYGDEFYDKFDIVKVYPRVAMFMGKPIPIVLMRNKSAN